MDKLYLTSIARYLFHLTGKRQQIIHSKDYGATYKTDFIIICDSDSPINSVDWNDEIGITINGIDIDCDAFVHVFLWNNEFEVDYDDIGCFIDKQGALNGILVIDNHTVCADQVEQILQLQEDN